MKLANYARQEDEKPVEREMSAYSRFEELNAFMVLLLPDKGGKELILSWEQFQSFRVDAKGWISNANKENGSSENKPQGKEDDDGVNPS